MRVVLTEAAWADVLNIGLAIKEHNASRAESFVNELYDRCKQLGDMPFAYPLLRDHEATGIRRRVHGNYLIFYRIEGDTVQIIHVLHGAMDYERLLFPED
jgi:plasmid stabilization system protein ParE